RRAMRITPSKVMLPALGSYKPARHRARVDFPHPDSPTTPSASPRNSSRSTPSSATNRFDPRRNSRASADPSEPNSMRRPLARSSVGGIGGCSKGAWQADENIVVDARGGSVAVDREHWKVPFHAVGLDVGASRMERAA